MVAVPVLVVPTGPDNVNECIDTLESIEKGTQLAKEPTQQVEGSSAPTKRGGR